MSNRFTVSTGHVFAKTAHTEVKAQRLTAFRITAQTIGAFLVTMALISGSAHAVDELVPPESAAPVDQLDASSESSDISQPEAVADEELGQDEAKDIASPTQRNQNTCSASVSPADLKSICTGIAKGDRNVRGVIKAIGDNPNLRELKSLLENDTLPHYAQVAETLRCQSGATSVSDQQLTSVCGELSGALTTVNSFVLKCSGFSPICATAEAAWRMYKPMATRGIQATEAESNCQCINANRARK